MAKLTLSVDDQVVSSAKRYAKQRGVSVSEMVEAYLSEVANAASLPNRNAPILRSVRGSLKKADLKEYRKHLAIKYR
ncbi:MAG TPA: DUF6364 family protein [Candidatus Binataceae bacterium]|nr:DUF6364 family protein [Candidatus Binataceae bacterium]